MEGERGGEKRRDKEKKRRENSYIKRDRQLPQPPPPPATAAPLPFQEVWISPVEESVTEKTTSQENKKVLVSVTAPPTLSHP